MQILPPHISALNRIGYFPVYPQSPWRESGQTILKLIDALDVIAEAAWFEPSQWVVVCEPDESDWFWKLSPTTTCGGRAPTCTRKKEPCARYPCAHRALTYPGSLCYLVFVLTAFFSWFWECIQVQWLSFMGFSLWETLTDVHYDVFWFANYPRFRPSQ